MRLAAVLVSITLLAAAGCGPKRDPLAPYDLIPVAGGAFRVAGTTRVLVDKPGVSLELESMDDAERAAWLRARLELEHDPLVRHGFAPRFVTFRMRVKATSELPVHIETQAARIWSDRGRLNDAPLDYTRAFELLRPDRGTAPEAAEIKTFMRGLYDGSIDLTEGETIEGLLVFPIPDPDSKEVMLELPFVQTGSETHRLQIPFVKRYKADEASAPAASRG